jgi:hypothetical protein
MNQRQFLDLGGCALLIMGVAVMMPNLRSLAADTAAAQPSFVDKIVNGVIATSLLTELSPEAQGFVRRELSISKEELRRINTVVIPEQLMESFLTKEDLRKGLGAYFYMYREQFEEARTAITGRINAACRKQSRKPLTYGETIELYDRLEKKIFGPTRQKRQHVILLLPKNETAVIRDFRILHELKHHAQNLPVYMTEKEHERVENEATAFQMLYLMSRGFTLPQVLEAFDVPEKLTGKESRAQRKEMEKNRKTLMQMWEELKHSRKA